MAAEKLATWLVSNDAPLAIKAQNMATSSSGGRAVRTRLLKNSLFCGTALTVLVS